MTDFRIASMTLISNIRQRRATMVFAIIAALFSIFLISLPYGIHYGLQRWLASQGASHAGIEDIDFNIFTGTLRVTNLQSGDGNTRHAHIGEASLTMRWLPLLRNRFYFDDIVIKDSVLDVKKHADGSYRIGGLTVNKSSGHTKNKGKTVGIGVQKITVMNSKVQYLSPDLGFTTSVHQMTVGPLSSWKPASAAPVELNSDVNGGELLFTGQLMPFSNKPSLAGRLRLSRLPVDIFNALLLPETVSAKGTVKADIRINVALSSGQQHNTSSEPSPPEHIMAGNISLQGLQIDSTDKHTSLWKSDQIGIKNIRLSKTDLLSIDSVDIQNTTTNLQRDAQGKWLVIQDIVDKYAAEKDTQSKPVSVFIGQVSAGNKNIINIHDEMSSPVFKSRIDIKKAVVSRIDSTHPGQPGDFQLTGKIDEHGGFSISGQMQPFSSKLNLDINAEIKGIDLPPFTSYSQRNLGYILKSGHMDSDIKIRIMDDVINGDAKLQINNLKIVAGDPARMQALSSQLSMPLETAVSMLRDNKNNIQLQVPVSGNINDPAFDYSDAINQAIGKATRTAALSYLKYTLGPFGTLIAVGQLAGKISSSIKLEPVKFEPGRASLDKTVGSYLSHIADLLTRRPELHINICGVAVASDRAILSEQDIPVSDEQLQALAKQRATIIRDYLVKQYAIKPERLFICNPEILPDKDASPQAGLSI